MTGYQTPIPRRGFPAFLLRQKLPAVNSHIPIVITTAMLNSLFIPFPLSV